MDKGTILLITEITGWILVILSASGLGPIVDQKALEASKGLKGLLKANEKRIVERVDSFWSSLFLYLLLPMLWYVGAVNEFVEPIHEQPPAKNYLLLAIFIVLVVLPQLAVTLKIIIKLLSLFLYTVEGALWLIVMILHFMLRVLNLLPGHLTGSIGLISAVTSRVLQYID